MTTSFRVPKIKSKICGWLCQNYFIKFLKSKWIANLSIIDKG